MTGALGITTVPIPAFWSSSKDEGEQFKRPLRKAHLCQNPRCAANTAACKEPPAKRIKRPLKNTRSKSLSLVSSNNTPTESENSNKRYSNSGRCADCDVALLPSTQPLREPCTLNTKGSTGMTSKGYTTPISPRSYIPSFSTPTRSITKPINVAHAPLSLQKRSSTKISGPTSGFKRIQTAAAATLPMSACPIPECHNVCDGTQPLGDYGNSPQGGRVAPPPSESDGEEDRACQRDQHQPPETMPPFCESPAELASTSSSTWPSTSPTDVGLSTRLATLAPKSSSSKWTSSLSPRLTTLGAAMPQPANVAMKPSNVRPEISKIPTGRCRSKIRTSILAGKGTRDVPTGLSAMASMGKDTPISALEQAVEEDNRSTLTDTSDLTVSSDSPKETCSTELCTTCGKNPVSAFYNALYTPDCSMIGTNDFDLRNYRRASDRKFRVAIEIALLSVMVTVLVAVFYPIIIRGLRSHFYGCCSCPAASGTLPNPNQLSSQMRSHNSWAYRGVQNLLTCPLAKQAMGSTALK